MAFYYNTARNNVIRTQRSFSVYRSWLFFFTQRKRPPLPAGEISALPTQGQACKMRFIRYILHMDDNLLEMNSCHPYFLTNVNRKGIVVKGNE